MIVFSMNRGIGHFASWTAIDHVLDVFNHVGPVESKPDAMHGLV